MLHKKPFKPFQYSTLAAAMFISLASVSYATDSREESQSPRTQSESSQPQQQATPTKPAVEPVDEDGGTALA